MKNLRLLLFSACNRTCEGCCNKDFDLPALPVCDLATHNFSIYNTIMLTGGEPMLNPMLVIHIARMIQERGVTADIIMYTAKPKRALDLVAMLYTLDGITLTLHEPYDAKAFDELNTLMLTMGFRDKLLRLNVFKGVDISGIDTSLWRVKDNIEWIKNCPLPDNEVFMRLP